MIARTKPFRQKFCTDNTLQHILGFTLTLGLLLTLSYCDILKIKLSGRKKPAKIVCKHKLRRIRTLQTIYSVVCNDFA